MIIIGLGMGASLSLFVIIVQNAFPISRIGDVTASLTFFRQLGGAVGLAVLDSILNSRFQSGIVGRMPEGLRESAPVGQLDQLTNPQILLAADAVASVRQEFDALGPQGPALFEALAESMRLGLAAALTDLYLIAGIAMLIAIAVLLFLKEIPLRTSNAPIEAEPASDPERSDGDAFPEGSAAGAGG